MMKTPVSRAFEVTDLYKSFGAETAVNNGVSLRVEPLDN